MFTVLFHTYLKVATEFQRYLNAQISAQYGRNTKTIYYDVTNFYFEIDEADEFRKFGFSKEKRRDPIVQMGLAMDADGIPLHYELFPGNTVDKETFRPVIGEVRRNYDKVEEIGTGPAVLLVHGIPTDYRVWRPQVD